MSPNYPKLRAGVGSVASVMSKFVHPSNPIRDKYPNWAKNHKLQGVVLLEVDATFVRRGANAILVFVFTYFNFPEPTILCLQAIHPCDQRGWRVQPICLSRGCHLHCQHWRHRSSGSWWKQSFWWCRSKRFPDLLLVCTSNLRSEDMVELRRQGIAINDDKYPAPDNVPRQGETATGTGIWRREGIICHRKSGNIQNYFTSFRYYYHDAILRMSLLQLFLIMFP